MHLTNLVIGSSLEALLFAFYNKIKIIYARNMQPSPLDVLEDFGLGKNKKKAWDKHMFQLSLAGYVPFEDKVKHLRYEDANTIKVITKEDNVYTVNFDNIYVFDDYNFLDVPVSTSSTSKECRIIDYFKYNSKKLLHLENIRQRSRFLNQIIFDNRKRTVTCISYVKKNKLDDYPEHLVKIKTQAFMNSEKTDLDHQKREVSDLGQNVYDDFDNVVFVYTDAKLMFDFHKTWVKIDYMKYLRLKLGIG